MLHAVDEERRSSPYNLTLRELAELAREDDRDDVADEPPRRAGATNGNGKAVLDAKQPDL